MSRRLLHLTVALAALLGAACAIDPINLDGKECPCAAGWVCDESVNRCVQNVVSGEAPVCGNGVTELGETCDEGECAASCIDGNACTVDSQIGEASSCDMVCMRTAVEACTDDDGCCPPGCNGANDTDCSTTCGNLMLEIGESCDPPESCPSTCDDGNTCTADLLVGSAGNCNVTCSHSTISACEDDDGCCPGGCNSGNDNDCSATCGDGVLNAGETCDPSGSCPTSCNDGNACTMDSLSGSAANCNAACTFTPIVSCLGGDGCCPAACDATNDSDCSASCGNQVVEPGETCDPAGTCPTTCDDGNACTIDGVSGSSDNCNLSCTYTSVVSCIDGDGCCPGGCNSLTDDDCSASCGNGILEGNEKCDPPGSCPTSCNDGNACTVDTLTGSASGCSAQCSYSTIVACSMVADGCCPVGCDASTDTDCPEVSVCGNGVVEPGELCDGNCPVTCDDGFACTIGTLVGSPSTCDAVCLNTYITECQSGDGCCPFGCTSANDSDCSTTCSNCQPGLVCSEKFCEPLTF